MDELIETMILENRQRQAMKRLHRAVVKSAIVAVVLGAFVLLVSYTGVMVYQALSPYEALRAPSTTLYELIGTNPSPFCNLSDTLPVLAGEDVTCPLIPADNVAGAL